MYQHRFKGQLLLQSINDLRQFMCELSVFLLLLEHLVALLYLIDLLVAGVDTPCFIERCKMLTVLRGDLMQHHSVRSVLDTHRHHQPLLRTSTTIDISCTKHEVILSWHLMHHDRVVSHALGLWAGGSGDLLTEMLTIEIWITRYTLRRFEATTSPASLVPIQTGVMCVAGVVVAASEGRVGMLVMVCVLWAWSPMRSTALVIRHRGEGRDKRLLFLDLLSKSLDFLAKFFGFFLELGVLLEEHFLIGCWLKPRRRARCQRSTLLIHGLIFNLFVHCYISSDTHSSRSKQQSRVRFIIMDQRRTDTSTYRCFTVASQAFSKESSKLAISKRHMDQGLFLSKSWNAVTQGSNRFINVLSFFKAHAFRASFR